MKTKFNLFGIFFVAVFCLGLHSCEQDNEEENIPEAATLTANLSECLWAPFNSEDETLFGLNIDFSNGNIEVTGPDGNVMDEGTWQIENSEVIFENLTGVLAEYNGNWMVLEDREVFLELGNGQTVINFEQSCN